MLKVVLVLLSTTAVTLAGRVPLARGKAVRGVDAVVPFVPVVPISPHSFDPVLSTAAILNQVQEFFPGGSYYFSYRTSNGISAEERGDVYPQGPGMSTKTVQGRYDYTSPEGVPVSVNYNADKNGFRPMTRLGHIGAGGASRPRMNTQQK